MAVLVQCKAHPQYMGQKRPKTRVPCDSCQVLYDLIHGEYLISGEDDSRIVASKGRK